MEEMKLNALVKARTNQGDPISTYHSILVLEVAFVVIESNKTM